MGFFEGLFITGCAIYIFTTIILPLILFGFCLITLYVADKVYSWDKKRKWQKHVKG